MAAADALSAIDDLLRPKGIDWMVIGAHAANLYRDELRATRDVDVLLSLSMASMTTLANQLVEAGWQVRHRTADNWLVRARHAKFGDVDLMCVQGEYQQAAFGRSVGRQVNGVGIVKFLTPEDVIVHKLIANRHQDQQDVMSILKAGVPLDREYMARWLKKWDMERQYDALATNVRSSGAEKGQSR